MHDKHERSRKHLENSGTQEEELSEAGVSKDNRADDLYDRMGRRKSDDGDIVIIEDKSAKISEKKRGPTRSFNKDIEKEVEKEENEGDCTDCLKPMGDVDEHMRRTHKDLFISCRLCLEVIICSSFVKKNQTILFTGWLFSLSGSVLG